MANIWITSDTHYAHKNICYGVSEWEDKERSARRFDTLEEMNSTIVGQINNFVKEDDILYHLGDWSFGEFQNIKEFKDKLIVKDIRLVLGNHDNNIKKNKENSKELFTEILPQGYKLKINKTTLILSHYPIDRWEDCEFGSIHLHGHTHHSLDTCDLNVLYRRMDVGIDWEEFRPYHIDEVLSIKDRPYLNRY